MSQLGKSSGTGGPPVRLGDIAKARMGKTILSKELIGEGVPVYSAGRDNEPWGYVPSSDLLFGEETIVIAARGNIGFPRVPRITPFVSTQTTIAISFKDSRHVPYLRYQLETVNWPGMTSQTTIPMVTVRQVEGIEVRLPHFDEQRRIVAEIEKQFTRLEAGVAALRRVQANLKRYRAAVLKAACEGRLVPTEVEVQKSEGRGQKSKAKFETGAELLARILTERRQNWQGRGQYKEPAVPEPMADVVLPEGWIWTGFEQLADGTKNAIKAGPFGSSLKKSYYTLSGFKIYGQEQVIKGDAYFGDYFISRELFEQLQSCEVKSGDILISLVGTTGKVLILPDDCAPGIINPRLLKLSLNRSGVNAKFIKILLESATTRAFFKLAAHGGTMEILNLGILKTLPIALPPLAEQTRIVAEVERRLSVVEELESVVSANLQRASSLR